MKDNSERLFSGENSLEDMEQIFKRTSADYKDVGAFNAFKKLVERTNNLEYLYAYYLQTNIESLKQSGILPLIENGSIELSGGPETDGTRLMLGKYFTTQELLDFWNENSKLLESVKRLSCGENKIKNKEVRALTKSKNLQNLTSLDLYGKDIGDKGVRLLTESKYLGNLTKLDLGGNDIGPEGVRMLVESNNLPKVVSLDLGSNEIGDEGVRLLTESPYLQNLTSLKLSYTKIGDEGARALAESKYLQNLTSRDFRKIIE